MKNQSIPTANNATPKTTISAAEVLKLYQLFQNAGIAIWLDGGWGVDALLGNQTRDHEDMDIVTQNKDVPKLRAMLTAMGFKNVPRDDTSAWNFVLGDKNGRQVDFHAITLDANGNGLYGPAEKGIMYPAGSLTGTGKINGYSVKCTEASHLVKFHTGYPIDQNDIKDVTALCKKFNISLPKEYQNLR